MDSLFHNYPLIRLLIPLIGGIIISDYGLLTSSSTFLLILVLSLYLMLLVGHICIRCSRAPLGYNLFGLATFMFFFIWGYLNYSIQMPITLPQEEYYVGLVSSDIDSDEERKYIAFDLLLGNGSGKRGKVRCFIYLSEESFHTPREMAYGDQILFRGEIRQLEKKSERYFFNYHTYLKRKGYSGIVNINSSNVERLGNSYFDGSLESYIVKFKKSLKQYILHSSLSTDSKGLLIALFFGDKAFVSDVVIDKYAVVGISHVLAQSGLHVGLLMALVIGFTSLLLSCFKWKKQLSLLLGVILLWIGVLFVGASPSLVRAGLFFSIYVLGLFLQREMLTYQALLSTGFIMLLINPAWLYDVGFQLSFSAVLGILSFLKLFRRTLFIKNIVIRYLVNICLVSIGAQIGTLPLVLYYFGSFPLYFLLANILVIPLITGVLYLGVLFLFSFSIPFLADVSGYLLNYLVSLLTRIVNTISNFPNASINYYLSLEELLLVYLMLFFVYHAIRHGLSYRKFVVLIGCLIGQGFVSIMSSELVEGEYLVLDRDPFIHQIYTDYSQVTILRDMSSIGRIEQQFRRYWSVNNYPQLDRSMERKIYRSGECVILKSGVSLCLPQKKVKRPINYKYDYLYLDLFNIDLFLDKYDEYQFDKVILNSNIQEAKKICLKEKLKAKNIEIMEFDSKAYVPLLP